MKKMIAMAALALTVSFASTSCKKKTSDADLQTSATKVVTTNPNATVEVNAVDPANMQKVSDALKDFPSAKAEVVNGELTITGTVSQAQARKIKESVDALQVGKVKYNYTVK